MRTIFYINLDRMKTRRSFMEMQLNKLGEEFAIERFPAVDAATLTDENSPCYLPGRWGSSRWELSKYHVAVFESHRRIWTQIVEQKLECAVILEDDVLLSTGLVAAISEIDKFLHNIDVVKVDGINARRRFGPVMDGIGLEIRPIVEQPLHSAAAYVVSHEGAGKLLDWSSRYSDGLDYFIFLPRMGYRLYQLIPAVAVQGMFREDSLLDNGVAVPLSGVPDLGSDGRVLSKGPIPYRMFREVQRGVRRVRRFLVSDWMLVRRQGWIGEVPLAVDLGSYR